ncbi:MAG: PAS domain S-box protein [candidate division WOR-3 bacterium]|jgi:PAS domain S-box-containing protein|nr:PAS domain S-box protein [candidate division WOR-3 bacterium]MCR4424411.1 PAS domain S-box protein [candidate division WOR-3 bacterium]MDH7518229.1 PAS domain S-box protein [bacterium]
MLFPKGPDPKRLLEEQAAFEEAERKKAEARARVLFDSFVDFCPVGVEIFDTAGNLVKSNKAAERLLGKLPPPGINLFEEKGLKRTGLLEPQIKRLLAGARVETPPFWYDAAELGLASTPGKKVCIRTTAFPLLNAEGVVQQIAIIYEDLTELKKVQEQIAENQQIEKNWAAAPADIRDVEFARRKIEQALRESEERYRGLVDSAQDVCIIRFSEEGRIIAISPSVENIFGVSREAVMTDNSALFAHIHPEDISRVKQIESEAKKTGSYPPDYQFRVVKNTNETTWVKMTGRAITFASRRTFEALAIDITREKQLEELLNKKNADIGSLLTSPSDGFFAINQEWTVTAWSKGAEKETRVTAAEALGKRLWELYPEMEKTGMAVPLRRTLLERTPQYQEFFYTDGRDRFAGWFSLTTYPLDNGALALMKNLSSRKKIEQAWQDSESRLKAIIENPLVLIAFKDREHRYVTANETAQRLLGAGTDIVGKTDAELFPATVTALIGSYDRQVLETGKGAQLEFALGDPKQETTVWLAIAKQPWRNANNEVIGILDIGFDITRRVHAQQELTRRREFFEKLLSGIKQEFDRWGK